MCSTPSFRRSASHKAERPLAMTGRSHVELAPKAMVFNNDTVNVLVKVDSYLNSDER